MKMIVTVIEMLPTVIQNTALMIRFKAWQKEARKEGKLDSQKSAVVKVLLVIALAATSMAATCRKDIQDFEQYCREHPEEGGLCNTFRPKPPVPPVPVEVPQCCKDQAGVYKTDGAPGRACSENDRDCWHDPADGCDSCWKFIPPPTAAPTATPTQQPTRTPVVGATPTPGPQPTPFCVQPPGPEPLGLAFWGACPPGHREIGVPLPSGSGARACALDYGEGNHNTAKRLEMGQSGFTYEFLRGQVVQKEDNAGRIVCIDRYGRTFWACDQLYVAGDEYPDKEKELYSTNGYTKPPYCEATPVPTPVGPTPTPPVPTGGMPTLYKIKVQNVDNKPNTRSAYGCHNPITGDRFAKNNWCESGSTGMYEQNANTLPGPSGPCDPLHAQTFLTVCGGKEPNVVPRWTVTGSVAEWHVADNPHHVDVKFIPGSCYTICASAPEPAFAADGSPVPVKAGNMTCAEHCY